MICININSNENRTGWPACPVQSWSAYINPGCHPAGTVQRLASFPVNFLLRHALAQSRQAAAVPGKGTPTLPALSFESNWSECILDRHPLGVGRHTGRCLYSRVGTRRSPPISGGQNSANTFLSSMAVLRSSFAHPSVILR
jgi:hypothetical protein